MTLNEYQKDAKKTAIYPKRFKLLYPVMGLAGEAGEVANKVKKLMRDKKMKVSEDEKEWIANEVGDCLWYLSAVATDIGYGLDEIAEINLSKLESRMKRKKLKGSGDKR